MDIKPVTQLMFSFCWNAYCGSKRLHVSAGRGHHQVFLIRCF